MQPTNDDPGRSSNADSPSPDVRQDVNASDRAQQAALGSGIQNVYFGDRGRRAEAPVSIVPPFGQRDAKLPVRGRDDVIATFTRAVTDAGVRVWLVHGLGGCGKTRIAMEVAYLAQQRGTEVWWVSAADSSGLVAGMRALGRRLKVTDAELDHGDAADVIWQRLSERLEPWLLVIDNADDPQVLAGAGQRVGDGRGWLRPVASDTGMVVVTSRDGSDASWGPWCSRLRLTSLPADEAADMLADHTGQLASLGSHDEARALATRLGGLPLALKIAGSYLGEAAAVPAAFADGGLIRTYQQYYDALERGRLGEVSQARGGELIQDLTPDLVSSTWDLSLDLLDARQMPEARRLLRLLATFADAPLPYQTLLHPPTITASPLFGPITGSRLWQALQALDGFGLIDLDSDSDEMLPVARLHPLVRDASSPRPGSTEERAAYLDLAARLAKRAAISEAGEPEDPRSWPLWQLLAPHAIEVFTVLESQRGIPADTMMSSADAAAMAGRYRAEQRLHAQSIAILRRVAAARAATLGADHPDTLDTRHSIGRRMLQQRDYAGAEAVFREVLAARLRVDGPDHPDTLSTRHSIARTMAGRGDYAGAQAEYDDVLAARLLVLGPDHPRTLGTRHEIARSKAALGDHAAAQAEFSLILTAQLAQLGTEHPHTLGTRHELAATTAALGDHESAQAEFRDILAARIRVLGPDHPHTLGTRHELAAATAALGDHESAQAEFREVLAARVRVLGSDHPQTIQTAQRTEPT